MTDDRGQDMEMAQLGIEAEDFKRSPLCRFMLEMAAREEAGLEKQLRTVNPAACQEIRAIQNQLQVFDMFREYLDSIINTGQLATSRIAEEDSFED